MEISHVNGICMGVLHKSLIVVGLLEPLDAFRNGGNRSTSDLCIQTVIETFVKVTLNRLFVLHHLYVIVHLLESSQNDGFSFFVVLRSTSSTEYLLHIEYSNVFVCTS